MPIYSYIMRSEMHILTSNLHCAKAAACNKPFEFKIPQSQDTSCHGICHSFCPHISMEKYRVDLVGPFLLWKHKGLTYIPASIAM